MRLGFALFVPFLCTCLCFAQSTNSYNVRLSNTISWDLLQTKNISVSPLFRNSNNSVFLNSFVQISPTNPTELDAMVEQGILLYWENKRVQELYFTPSDESFNQQWYLNKINAPEVWDSTQGDSTYFV